MNLFAWARKWGVSDAAVLDLRTQMGIDPTSPQTPVNTWESEADVQKKTRLVNAVAGNTLWRNNVGAMQDANGRTVRFGLANESAQMNKQVKSADLIGIKPVIVTGEMVGTTHGLFVAIETKAPGWVYSGGPRETAQRKFLELVAARGGIARFLTEPSVV